MKTGLWSSVPSTLSFRTGQLPRTLPEGPAKLRSVSQSQTTCEPSPALYRFGRADFLAAFSLFTVGLLVYGSFAGSLGFYWDDWPVIWVYRTMGPAGLASYYAGNRPVVGWIDAHLFPLLGIGPTPWHILAALLWCASAVVTFVGFSALWPAKRSLAWLTAALMLLYPGFTQLSIGLTYIPHFMGCLLIVCSLAATIFSRTARRWRLGFVVLGVLTAGFSYLITEYFIGIELFRVAVIDVLHARQKTTRSFGRRVAADLLAWAPYAAIWTAYAVWRAFVFRVAATASYKDVGTGFAAILRHPARELWVRSCDYLQNILTATVFAWTRPFKPDLATLRSPAVLISWAFAAVVVVLSVVTIRYLALRSNRDFGNESSRVEAPSDEDSALRLSLAGLAFAGLPFVVNVLYASFTSYPSFEDRFTLPFALPASLAVAALLSLARDRVRAIVAAAILFACCAYQVQNEAFYRRDWGLQKSLVWQIAWRSPGLAPGTSIFAEGLPKSISANHTAGMLDLLYDRSATPPALHYFIFDMDRLKNDEPLREATGLSFQPEQRIAGILRSFRFEGTTSQALVWWIAPSGTLRMVRNGYANELLDCSADCVNLAALSRPGDVIDGSAAEPGGALLKIFGPEPKHEWPYFYQRAALNRQLGNWAAVAQLGDEAIRKGLQPEDASEWFPFIEGYARSGNYKKAQALSTVLLRERPDAVTPLSSLWQRIRNP